MEYLTLGLTVLNTAILAWISWVQINVLLASSKALHAEPYTCPNCREPLWESSGVKFKHAPGQDYVDCPKCVGTHKAELPLPIWARYDEYLVWCMDPECSYEQEHLVRTPAPARCTYTGGDDDASWAERKPALFTVPE